MYAGQRAVGISTNMDEILVTMRTWNLIGPKNNNLASRQKRNDVNDTNEELKIKNVYCHVRALHKFRTFISKNQQKL